MPPAKWAILVGLNYIPPHSPGRRHHGCVSDVKRISSFLQEAVAFPPQNIFELTADEPTSANVQVENAPTYDNVLRAFEVVRTRGRPGDTVYVHFSTASDSRRALVQTYNSHRTENTLLLLDNDGGCHNLHALELAVLVNRLLKASLDVTVTVDARELTLPVFESRQSSFSQAELAAQFHGFNIPKSHANTLVNPDVSDFVLVWTNFSATADGKYTIREYQDPESSQRHGLLTHFLLCILSRYGLQLSWSTILRLLQSETFSYCRYIESHPEVVSAQAHGKSTTTGVGLVSSGRKERLFLESCDDRLRLVPMLLFPAQLAGSLGDIYLKMSAGLVHAAIRPGTRVQFIPNYYGEPRIVSAVPGNEFIFEVTSMQQFSSILRPILRPINATPMSHQTPARIDDVDLVHGAAKVLESHEYGYRPVSVAAHLEAYSLRLSLSTNDDMFQQQINVFPVGGYRYSSADNAPSAPCPTIASDGRVHLLGGDYATVVVSNMSSYPRVFLHILCFDSAFGITQIYPESFSFGKLQTPIRYSNIGRTGSHFSVNVRLWSPPGISTDSPAMSYIKIILTNTPTSFHSLELAPIEGSVPPSLLDHGNIPRCQRITYEDPSLVGLYLDSKLVEIRDDDPPRVDEKWCCFNVAFAVHHNAESLASITGYAGYEKGRSGTCSASMVNRESLWW